MVRKLVTLVLSAAAVGCAAHQPWSFNIADFHGAKELPYDSPPQVIYRLDDHRFVTLEHYRDCNHGDTYYNNTKAGIRTHLGRGTVENYQGHVINADPTGMNLVFPGAAEPEYACSERGCSLWMMYSTDGGKTFYGMDYIEHGFNPYEESKDFSIYATKDALYVTKKLGETTSKTATKRYLIISGLTYASEAKLATGKYIDFNAHAPSELRTPSGQDHFICDVSIKPTNPDAPLMRDR